MHGHLNVKYWQQVKFTYSLRQLTKKHKNNLLTKLSDIPSQNFRTLTDVSNIQGVHQYRVLCYFLYGSS